MSKAEGKRPIRHRHNHRSRSQSLHSPKPALEPGSDSSSSDSDISFRPSKRLRSDTKGVSCTTPSQVRAPDPFPMERDQVLRREEEDKDGDVHLDFSVSDLCPVCDQRWPTVPSAFLSFLLDAVNSVGVRAPSDVNPGHVVLPAGYHVDVCARHRHETGDISPSASVPSPHSPTPLSSPNPESEEGWPTALDFDSIPGRLVTHLPRLLEITSNPVGNRYYDSHVGRSGPDGGRRRIRRGLDAMTLEHRCG